MQHLSRAVQRWSCRWRGFGGRDSAGAVGGCELASEENRKRIE